MAPLLPLLRLFRSLDERLERMEVTPWGNVATDSRFPQVFAANSAAIGGAVPDVTLGDVEAVLLPALERSGSTHVCVWLFAPDVTVGLVDELRGRGHEPSWDTVMVHEAPGLLAAPHHPVLEIGEETPGFRYSHREAFRLFGITDPVIDELLDWQRQVLIPYGKRWFAVFEDGEIASLGGLTVHREAAYLDDVVTFPPHRGRGMAGAVVSRMVDEAARAGATWVYLLADDPRAIGVYERAGFVSAGSVATFLRPRSQPVGVRSPQTAQGALNPPG